MITSNYYCALGLVKHRMSAAKLPTLEYHVKEIYKSE